MSMPEFELPDAKTPSRKSGTSCILRRQAAALATGAPFSILCAMRTPPTPPRPPGGPPPRGPTPPPRGPTPPRGPAPARPVVKVSVQRAKPRGPAWLARAQRVILHPRQEWAAIAGEFTSAGPIYRGFLLPVAAIGPLAATVGTIISGGERSSL